MCYNRVLCWKSIIYLIFQLISSFTNHFYSSLLSCLTTFFLKFVIMREMISWYTWWYPYRSVVHKIWIFIFFQGKKHFTTAIGVDAEIFVITLFAHFLTKLSVFETWISFLNIYIFRFMSPPAWTWTLLPAEALPRSTNHLWNIVIIYYLIYRIIVIHSS